MQPLENEAENLINQNETIFDKILLVYIQLYLKIFLLKLYNYLLAM